MTSQPKAAGAQVSRKVARAGTVGAAVLAALVGWLIERGPLGMELAVRSGDGTAHVTAASVIGVTLVVALVAWAFLEVLQRMTRRPRRAWTVVAGIVLVLSLAVPLTSARGMASMVSLVLLHCVVGLVLILGMARTAPGQRHRPARPAG